MKRVVQVEVVEALYQMWYTSFACVGSSLGGDGTILHIVPSGMDLSSRMPKDFSVFGFVTREGVIRVALAVSCSGLDVSAVQSTLSGT